MKAELVERVKELQRSSQDNKQAWWDYCDKELGGIRDPNRHGDDVLSAFLDFMEGGPPPAAAPRPQQRPRNSSPMVGGMGGMGGRGGFPMMGGKGGFPMMGGKGGSMKSPAASNPEDLVSFVKLIQRSSRELKEGWTTYCQMYGGGMNDPSRHDPTYILGFMQYLGQLAMHDLTFQQQQAYMPPMMMGPVGGVPGGGMGRKRPMDSGMMFGGEPPRKKAAKGKGGGKGGGEISDDPEKAALVDRVKALQRADQTTKQAWWQFTDESHDGVHDPNRHSKEVLQEFLSGYE